MTIVWCYNLLCRIYDHFVEQEMYIFYTILKPIYIEFFDKQYDGYVMTIVG